MTVDSYEEVIEACDELIEEMKEMPILLEDTEIIDAILSVSGTGGNNLPASNQSKAVARAQLKNVAKWGEEICNEHPFCGKRRDCIYCWQSLKEEAGL